MADADKLYSTLRDYLKHEDSLINWRISWNLGLQTALFAAFGLLLKKSDLGSSTLHIETFLHYGPYGLAIVGQLIGMSSFLGVIAAHRSLDALTARWNEAKNHVGEAIWLTYPPLSAAGDPFARRFGKWGALGPIIVLQTSWLLILAIINPVLGAITFVVPNLVILFELFTSKRPKIKYPVPPMTRTASQDGSG